MIITSIVESCHSKVSKIHLHYLTFCYTYNYTDPMLIILCVILLQFSVECLPLRSQDDNAVASSYLYSIILW